MKHFLRKCALRPTVLLDVDIHNYLEAPFGHQEERVGVILSSSGRQGRRDKDVYNDQVGG